jgi:hypothetical protein
VLLAVVFQGLPAAMDFTGKYAVAIHQRAITQELAEWGDEYSQIASKQDADRATEVIEYIKSYYVPAEGYRADSETEARLESQRKRTIDKISSAVKEWKSRNQD